VWIISRLIPALFKPGFGVVSDSGKGNKKEVD
jgi:hypothetical protein